MAGFLHDSKIIQNWAERTSAVDIDPSFPEAVTNEALIDADFLGDRAISTRDWIANGPIPDVCRYLSQQKVDDQRGQWISLDAYVAQEDKGADRSISCSIRSFLVSAEDASSIVQYFSKLKERSRTLPDKPSLIYTFAGEIPWCETYPNNGTDEFSFLVGQRTVKVRRSIPNIFLGSNDIEASQTDPTEPIESEDMGSYPDETQGTEANKPLTLKIQFESNEIEELKNEYVKFKAFVPVCDFGWEGHQTLASDPGYACSLAKEMAQELQLVGQPQTFDMFTRDGTRVTYNVSDQSRDYFNQQSIFYIREDILRQYLERHNLTLLWVISGERQYSHNLMARIANSTAKPEPRYSFYRKILQYE